MKEHKCPDCGKPCEAIECDSGIGPGEAWGVKFNDSRPYMGSDCCEAELDGVEWPECEDDGDQAYDQMKDREMEERCG
jgi:hypothetical protein